MAHEVFDIHLVDGPGLSKNLPTAVFAALLIFEVPASLTRKYWFWGENHWHPQP